MHCWSIVHISLRIGRGSASAVRTSQRAEPELVRPELEASFGQGKGEILVPLGCLGRCAAILDISSFKMCEKLRLGVCILYIPKSNLRDCITFENIHAKGCLLPA